MPLRDRKPQLLSLSIKPCSSSSASSADEVRTPLPKTPFSWTQSASVPMIMTPDTPFFDMGSVGGMLGKSFGTDVDQDELPTEPQWTEEEDETLSGYLSRPAAAGAYPPGTLPPPDVLDSMTTQILSRLSRSSSVSSLSSTSSSDTDVDMDVEEPARPQPKSNGGWAHSWSATRARLFRIARLESREALGGHTRNNSESFVPVSKEKLVRPKLVVLGGSGMSRQQHSMDNILVGSEQTIDEAVKLSSALQGQAMHNPSSVLHSTRDLSSPVTFEFGPSIHFTASNSTPSIPASLPLPRPSASRKAAPAFPTAKSLPRPSLLQRGRSYTGADLARERAHMRNPSTSSDDLDIDTESRDKASPLPFANPLLSMAPFSRPPVRRSATSPIDLTFTSSPSPTSTVFSLGSLTTGSSSSDDVEADPITPLNQTTFPQSALGLGSRVYTGFSDDSDSTPGSTPAITLTRTSPVSSPSLSQGSSTPRLGGSFGEMDVSADEFANLSLTGSSGTAPARPVALPFSSIISMPLGQRPVRPPPLGRSFSETVSLAALSNPAQLSTSTSQPSELSSLAMCRPSLSMTALPDRSDAPSGRENKRQRAMPFSNSTAAVCRPRLNPGLTVVVPASQSIGPAGEGLRSPFEHKAPSGAVRI